MNDLPLIRHPSHGVAESVAVRWDPIDNNYCHYELINCFTFKRGSNSL